MINEISSKIGVNIPNILLPKENADLTKWSVVACDQYTSQPEYWKNVESIVGDKPSTLNLILPEVYLEDDNTQSRINKINETMRKYLTDNVITKQKPGFIYIDRKTSHAPSRKGLIIAVDLEKYDYNKESQTLIRATEGTVLDRLPPRVKIRENALIELPHIMLLIDDPNRTVIEPLAQITDKLPKLYDFELMADGGHIKGFKVEDEKIVENILNALVSLSEPENFKKKYSVDDKYGVLLFAAGDGNHSLASAKAFWEKLKPTLDASMIENHPARYALVEVVNVHDDGLVFEPIHRVVFDVQPKELVDEMVKLCNQTGANASIKYFKTEDEIIGITKSDTDAMKHMIPFTHKDGCGVITIDNPKFNLEVGTLQNFLDIYVEKHPECKIDYIHGSDVVSSLGKKANNIGFFLPAMDKHDLFKTVILEGALPRKTFSMGEAEEKRFYLESRLITL